MNSNGTQQALESQLATGKLVGYVTSVAEELISGLPRTNPASGQGRTWTRNCWVASSTLLLNRSVIIRQSAFVGCYRGSCLGQTMHGFYLFVLLLNISKKDENNPDMVNYFSWLKYIPKFIENLFNFFDNLQGTFRPVFNFFIAKM